MATKINLSACLMHDIVNPGETAWDPCHNSAGPLPWIAGTPLCLIIVLLLLAGGTIFWCPQARGSDMSQAQTLVPGNPLTFDEAVKIAIRQSPHFTKSSMEIDIRKLDETDSRYGMVPPLTFRTYYYVNQPSGLTNKPYSLSFSTDPYNPVGSYFLLQAQKLVSQIAVFKHLMIVSKGLESLGQIYLQMDSLNKMAKCQTDLINLCQENLTYAQNRLNIGTGTSMDVKFAQQELQLAKGEQEGIALVMKRHLTNLKNILGLPANQEINPDYRDSKRQVMGNFDPAAVTMDQAKSRSYEIKAIETQKKIQGYQVSLAIAKVFPSILFNTQTPDPLSVSTARGLYVGLGLEIPVWDGFKRIRDVSRQKAMQKQVESQKVTSELNLEDIMLAKLAKIQEKKVDLNYARSREELARLKAQQNEVRYQSGQAPLPEFLESRKEVLSAQKETLRKALAYDIEVLGIREISGDLGYSYVDAKSWQK